jgi:DNA-binding NarL/FixJ family response regulator
VKRWLATRPRFHVHFTPTYASWLNQVEILPEMNGAELMRQAKATGKYTPTAVAISGFSDLAPRDAYDLGIEAQLSKPAERKVLISTLRRTLRTREGLWAEPFGVTRARPAHHAILFDT